MVPETEIFNKWKGQETFTRDTYKRPLRDTLQERHRNVKRSLNKVYRDERRLCLGIYRIFPKNAVFSLSS